MATPAPPSRWDSSQSSISSLGQLPSVSPTVSLGQHVHAQRLPYPLPGPLLATRRGFEREIEKI